MDWLNLNPKHRKFDVGVNILLRSGFKQKVAEKIQKHGEQPWTVEKLHYCLREMIQMYYNPDDPRFSDVDDADVLNAESPSTMSQESAKAVVKEENDKTKFDDMPHVIQVLIRNFSDAYKKRDILHKKLSSLPEDNDESTMKARAALSDEIGSLSELMDHLYLLRAKYEKDGTLPDINKITNIPAVKKEAPKEDNFDGLTKEQLLTRHRSLVNQIRRKENLLLYQTTSKKAKENPMPACPKRVKIENIIIKFKKTLESVDYALAKLI